MSDIPIQWDDGTKGYINGLWIKRLSPEKTGTAELCVECVNKDCAHCYVYEQGRLF